MPIKKKLWYKITLALAPFLYKTFMRTLLMTCRVEVTGSGNLEEFDRSGKPFILATWHYGLLPGIQQYRGRKWVAMISASKDGEYISRILESINFETVRGSRSRGGIGALKRMVVAVRERGRNAAIVADGSQGPAMKVQAGAVLLASKTGAPVVPFTVGADRYISFRSWDRTILPKPFSRVIIQWGEPLVVPPGLKADGIEEFRLKLEERLNDEYREVWGRFGKEEH
jgi:lysophospholipid acyltransferase (LPLAT)-like uncharacterized protein